MVEQVFGAVQYDRLCEQVARQLQETILAGDLPEGSQLPPERELAEKFRVSRTVIREAIKVLGERGLVEVVPGKGSFVIRLSTEAASLYMGLLVQARQASNLQLQEVRSALEVSAAGYAAARATPEDLVALRAAVDALDRCLDRHSAEEIVAAELKLHTLLADASHNPLFRVMLDPITSALVDVWRLLCQVTDSPRRGQSYHQLILQAIERGDPDAARDAMQQHMAQVHQDLAAGQTVGSVGKLVRRT
jgi:GntR family transcriptional regulator, transcriptional repressor for pyruvate dehydrogenase complex